MRGNRDVARVNRAAVPFSPTSRRRSSSTCACTVTSSPLVASSEMTSLGEQMSAMAMATRCAIPPLSSCAYAPKRCSDRESAPRADLQRQPIALGASDTQMIVGDIGNLPADRDDRIELAARIGNHHGEFAAEHRSARPIIELAQVAPVEKHLPAFDYAG